MRVSKQTISDVMRKMGSKGGKRSVSLLTPEELSARNRKAGKASARARKARKNAKDTSRS